MKPRLGIVMDPIVSIKPKKDTSLAMLLEAKRRGWPIAYMEQKDLYLADGIAYANMTDLEVFDDDQHWHQLGDTNPTPLNELDIILMRKDPPVDTQYLHTTQILDTAEQQGCLVVNKPQSLRDANEKLFATQFAQCCPEGLVSCDQQQLLSFLENHKQVVFKPLNSMGGRSIFLVHAKDPNAKVIIETLTALGTQLMMAQRFIPEISLGDKRIILINGEPVPYALNRIPTPGNIRGNLAAGGLGVGVTLTERDRYICSQVGPSLKAKGLVFVGIDVIGDYLTEINVTSPTCVREIDSHYNINICATLFDCLENQLSTCGKK